MTLPRRPVVMPDVVAGLIAVLSDELPGLGHTDIDAVHRIPTDRPSVFVRVLRTGGSDGTLISERAQITLEGWADTAAAAHDLCQAAKAIVFAMQGGTRHGLTVYDVQLLGGVAELPDPVSQQHRFTCTVLVHVRGAQI